MDKEKREGLVGASRFLDMRGKYEESLRVGLYLLCNYSTIRCDLRFQKN